MIDIVVNGKKHHGKPRENKWPRVIELLNNKIIF